MYLINADITMIGCLAIGKPMCILFFSHQNFQYRQLVRISILNRHVSLLLIKRVNRVCNVLSLREQSMQLFQ